MVVPAGMPESAVVLVELSAQELPLLSWLRSDPPVVTELMWPVSRTKRVMLCAFAARAPNSPERQANASNAKRHPRALSPRVPLTDGTLMGEILSLRGAAGRACLS